MSNSSSVPGPGRLLARLRPRRPCARSPRACGRRRRSARRAARRSRGPGSRSRAASRRSSDAAAPAHGAPPSSTRPSKPGGSSMRRKTARLADHAVEHRDHHVLGEREREAGLARELLVELREVGAGVGVRVVDARHQPAPRLRLLRHAQHVGLVHVEGRLAAARIAGAGRAVQAGHLVAAAVRRLEAAGRRPRRAARSTPPGGVSRACSHSAFSSRAGMTTGGSARFTSMRPLTSGGSSPKPRAVYGLLRYAAPLAARTADALLADWPEARPGASEPVRKRRVRAARSERSERRN